MSIIVKGMEMPDSCYHCKIAESCGHYITNYTDRRHPDCPLIALPDHHGRLVDADALKTRMLDYYQYSLQLCEEISDFFDNTPTIEPDLQPDGTLVVNTSDYDNVKRVLVQHGTNGTLFYVDAERKKGQWIKHVDDLFPAESTIECSECHHEQPLTIDSNFCPNCGADMREDIKCQNT